MPWLPCCIGWPLDTIWGGERRDGESISSGCAKDLDRLESGESTKGPALESREGINRLTPLAVEAGGVDCRRAEGDPGETGRRNGELRGEP